MLERIKRLAIPPAWRDVWVCPDATGHLQAIGRMLADESNSLPSRLAKDPRRKEVRQSDCFRSRFTKDPAARVARDLTRRGLTRDKVLATIVRLLETTLIRVGNDESAHGQQVIWTYHPSGSPCRSFAPALSRSSSGKSGKTNMFLMCAAEDSQGS